MPFHRVFLTLLFALVVVIGCAPAPTSPTALPSATREREVTSAPQPTTAPAVQPSATATAAPRPVSITFNWTAASGNSIALWTAVEAGYFKDENIDIVLVNIPSTQRAIAGLLSKEVQFTHADGQTLIEADLAGANVKMIYAINNRLVFSVMVRPEIKKPEDLKGKKLGITSIGASTHTAALLALRTWGLQPAKDVALLPFIEVPAILQAMLAGQVDGGVVSPPTNTRAKAAGFVELFNTGTEGPEWPALGVAATNDYLQANPDVALRVVRAYSRGVQRFKSDKAFAIQTLQKYLKLDDQAVLEDTWQQYSIYIAQVPYVAGMQTIIDMMSATNEKAKTAKVEDFIDARFVKQLDDEGFYKKLYGK